MVYDHLIKFGGNREQIAELLKLAEERFSATVYPVPDDIKDEVELKTHSAAYRGNNLLLIEYPSDENHKRFVELAGRFLLLHRGISNFGFPPISDKTLIKKIKKVKEKKTS